MSHIATLISNPKNPAVTRKVAIAAKALLPGAGEAHDHTMHARPARPDESSMAERNFHPIAVE